MSKDNYKATIKQQKKDIANAKKFQKQRKKQMQLAFKIINPCINYDPEYDILYVWFGGKNKVESTIELTDDLRVDISKKGNILAIEICNFSDYQAKGKFK